MKTCLQEKYGLFINGQWQPASDGKTFKSYNPANGELLAECAQATDADLDLAVDSAWKAWDSWKQTTPAERAKILNRIADIIDENAEHLAMVETLDNGKPIRETMAIDIPYSAEHFRYFAGAVLAEEGTAYAGWQYNESDSQRADWCCWSDCTLEFPIFDGCMEVGTSSCKRMLYRL